MLSEVKIPLYLAARGLNRQPIEFILGSALRNARATDPRDQFAVLAFAGNRLPDPMQGMRRVALDTTALFTLDYLGLLQKTIDAFDKIVISPTTLGSLFFDRQSIRFHQPSLVEKAKRITQLLADGHLKVLRGEKSNAEKAILKIDPDLQFLLDKARENGAVVIRSAPVHKLGSLLEEVADLSSYNDVMTDTRAALDLVRAKVVATVAQGAEAYLSQVDQGWPAKPDLTSGSKVYLDHLTVSYFDYVGILRPFSDAVAEVYVTQDVEGEANAILRASEISENLLVAIDRIRSVLNEGLEKRTVVFSSRKRLDDDDEAHDNAYDRRLPLLDILADLSDIDVVVCDDRFWNKDLFWNNETHRVPCANTLDLIFALNNRAKLSQAQKYEYLHKLRVGGYHAVPIEPGELLSELARALLDKHGLEETPELAAFRLNQSIAIRSRMLSAIELQWTDFTRLVVQHAIREVWSNNSSVETILAQADWLLAVMPMPFRLVDKPTDEAIWALAQQKTVTQLGLMLSPPAISRERQKLYSDWIDQKLVSQTRTHFPNLMQEAIRVLAMFLQRIVEEPSDIPRDVRRRFILQRVSGLHSKLESELLEFPGFAKAMGFDLINFVTFDNTLAVSADSFVNALKAALSKKRSASLTMKDGALENAKLKLVGKDAVGITVAGRTLGVADIDLLSSTRAARSKAFDRVFSAKPLAKSEESRWRVQGKKGLSSIEFIRLAGALNNTPEHLTLKLAAPQSIGEPVLVPNDIAYYTRLVGPIPSGPLLDDTVSRLAHQKYLLSKGVVGLRRIAHSSISHALIPFEHLKGTSDEQLDKLLELKNPFALVFGFEVCRFRLSQGDKAAAAEGTSFLKTLFASKSSLRSRCELFTACALVTTVALRPIANAANAPLDWFRLAALSHAGVLTDALKHMRKPKDFLKWASSQYATPYWWHTVVDTHEEPKWEAEYLFPEGIIAEIIGRCYQAMILLPKEDQPREWTTILGKAINGLKPKLRAFFPGPLDGFRPLSQGEGAEAAREELRKLLNDRVSFADTPGLVLLAHSGAIDRELTKEIARLLEASDEQLVNLEMGYQILKCGAYVASTTRDEQLAQIVVARCTRMLAADTTSSEFLRLLLLALRACSAHSDQSEYYQQVGIVVARFAYLASRKTAVAMSGSLQVLCRRDVHLMGALGRAMAVLEAQFVAEKRS